MSGRRAPRRLASALAAGALAACAALCACRDNQRIGDHVLVAYEGRQCPGYIVDKKSDTRFRIHFTFEGYDWEDDVGADKVLGRVQEAALDCPLPARVRATLGLAEASKSREQGGQFKVGDRVRVRWRGSVYAANVTKVLAPDTVVVHYQGHEDAWDETINIDRIESGRR
ncbi:MAG TPA: hypothetical protein VFS67_13720 [Polyangiaceae bacterium]|nr:hypothetical protein [Polyangiaceae bacterium]